MTEPHFFAAVAIVAETAARLNNWLTFAAVVLKSCALGSQASQA